ncbi:MAG: family 16 glycosylhydrolase, partial [Cyclobacteriaceae bacterium]
MKLLSTIILLSAILVAMQACSDDDGGKATNITGFSFDISSVEEGDTENSIMITVTANGSLGEAVAVPYKIEEWTATANEDFMPASGDLTFSESSPTAQIPLTILGDEYFELNEEVRITLTSQSGNISRNINIRNDDDMAAIEEDNLGYYTPDVYPSMEMVWADEFNGDMLNESDWNYELGDGCDQGICGWGNQELQVYTNDEQNIHLEEGRLIITARKITNSDFTSSRITTQDKQEIQFGRIDIRAKLPKGQGIWPALWMLGANINDVSWPACGEVDIMELVGHEPEKVHGTVHYESGGYQTTSSSYSLSNGDFSDQFHVFTLVWDVDQITWYVDNRPIKTFLRPSNQNYPFNAPFFFIFNVAVGGLWPGNPDATTVFPQTLEV